MVLVIGSKNSENSNQLVKVARALGKPAYLIDDQTRDRRAWLIGISLVGITSGASVPEQLVQEAVEFFQSQGAKVEHSVWLKRISILPYRARLPAYSDW